MKKRNKKIKEKFEQDLYLEIFIYHYLDFIFYSITHTELYPILILYKI